MQLLHDLGAARVYEAQGAKGALNCGTQPIDPRVRLAGPRQTTDAYLLALAQLRGMRLSTLDKRLAQAFPGMAFELPQAD